MHASAVPTLIRRSTALVAVLTCACIAACGGGGDSGGEDAGGDSGEDTGPLVLDTPQEILDYLEEKTMTMEGDAIPSHPYGFYEGTNFGSATQCHQRVTVSQSGGGWHVAEVRGTLNGATNVGDMGTCDHATASGELSFDTTQVLFENVMADCFEVTLTFPAFTWEGRGKISADGHTLSLELFFDNQATGHHCMDGAVGSATVQLNGQPFTGDAVQVYTIE